MRSTLALMLTSAFVLAACAGQRPALNVSAAPDDWADAGRGEARRTDGDESTTAAPLAPRTEPEPLRSYAARVPDVEVAPWYGFHRAALSLTFDDGTLDQYLLAFPELEKRGLKATFFVLTDFVESGVWQDSTVPRELFGWDQAREMAASGHEIGSHSRSHAELLGDGSAVEEELAGSRAAVDREVGVGSCVSFCWPFWRSDEASRRLAARHFIAARAGGAAPELYGGQNGGTPTAEPKQIYQVGSMGILSGQLGLWEEPGNRVFSLGGWIVLCLHGLDDGAVRREALGWQPMSLARFRALLDHIQTYDVWIAPFGDVARYIRERQRFSMRVLERTDKRIVVHLTDDLDDAVFDLPLSFRIRIPDDWEDAIVLQGTRITRAVLRPDGALCFEAVPDRGLVRIIRRTTPG